MIARLVAIGLVATCPCGAAFSQVASAPKTSRPNAAQQAIVAPGTSSSVSEKMSSTLDSLGLPHGGTTLEQPQDHSELVGQLKSAYSTERPNRTAPDNGRPKHER